MAIHRRRIVLGLGLIVLVVAHLAIVLSIFRQPLNVSARPPEARSWIWPLHNDTIHRIGPGADFFSVYRAGQVLAQGGNPYALEAPSPPVPYYYPFRYLPVAAWGIWGPLASVGPVFAYLYWILFLELILFGLLILLLRRLQGVGWKLAAAAALLLSSPYFLELHMGQFTFLTAALLSFGLVPLALPRKERGKSLRVAGAATGFTLAVLLKIFPLVAVPALLRRRAGWLVAAVAAVALAATTVPYFLAHPVAWKLFWQGNASTFQSFHAGNYGFLCLLFYALRDGTGGGEWLRFWPIFAQVWRLLILGGVALLVLRSRDRRLLPGAATLLIAHFVTYADVWEHHMSAVVVFGVWWLILTRQEGDRRGMGIALASLVLLALPTPFALFDTAADPTVMHPALDWSFGARLAVAGPKVLGVWLLLGLGLTTLWRGRNATASAVARPVDAPHPG